MTLGEFFFGRKTNQQTIEGHATAGPLVSIHSEPAASDPVFTPSFVKTDRGNIGPLSPSAARHVLDALINKQNFSYTRAEIGSPDQEIFPEQ